MGNNQQQAVTINFPSSREILSGLHLNSFQKNECAFRLSGMRLIDYNANEVSTCKFEIIQKS